MCHDKLMGRSGGERVALILAKAFDADLFVTKYIPEKTFEWSKRIRVREIASLPEPPISRLFTLVWMYGAIKFSQLEELAGYDLLITSGVLAHFASKQNPNNIWYCHTPNRALYDLNKEIRSRLSSFWKPAFDLWTRFWTPRDQKSVKHVRKIVVNSQNVRKRVRKFYNRDAPVIYPPVDTKKFYHKPAEDYWFSVQRIEPEKRVEIQLKIFEKLPKEKLVMVGEARYRKGYREKISRWIERLPNVEWREEVNDRQLRELYARCKGVIQTPLNEDFGLIPIEAMASGKPCIAVDEGGFRESIIHGKTGLLIKKPYMRNFIRAIKGFEKRDFDPKLCVKRAKEFSEVEFIRKLKKVALRKG